MEPAVIAPLRLEIESKVDAKEANDRNAKRNSLSRMFQLCTAASREIGTKANFGTGGSIHFDPPGYIQSIKRSLPWSKSGRNDLTQLMDLVTDFEADYRSGQFVLSDEQLYFIIMEAREALMLLSKAYDPKDPIVHALKLYQINLESFWNAEHKVVVSEHPVWSKERIKLVCANLEYLKLERGRGNVNTKLVASMLGYFDSFLNEVDSVP